MATSLPWQKILSSSIRDMHTLLVTLGINNGEELTFFDKPHFPILAPSSWVRRIEPGNPNDPLLLQIISQASQPRPDFSENPLQEDAFILTDGLLRKYHSRALLTLTQACPIHCQYCFRQHFPYHENRLGRKDIPRIIHAIQENPDIHEIIFSGGDPLSLPNTVLGEWLDAIDTLPQIKRVRFHTRFPVVIPERIDDAFCNLFQEKKQQFVMVIHANHPHEIDSVVREKCHQMHQSGLRLFNQSVLLARVNNNVDVLAELSEKLFAAQVMPYYIHALDRVHGAEAFWVYQDEIEEIFHGLRAILPGFLVPKFVREVPHDVSKTWLF